MFSFNSEKTLSEDINFSPKERDKMTANLTISEKVMKMEQRLEKEFENYFDREISEVSKAGDDIAQKLLEISKKNNIRPAVFWAIPEPEYLHLVLIYPGKKPLVQDIDFLKRENLIRKVKLFNNEITNPQMLFTNSYLSLVQQLYQSIVKPFEGNLQEDKIDTILFCLGAGLRTLPIAALHDGKQFLVEKYSLAIIPAFNLIDSNYTPIQKARILAMGASEFPTQSPLQWIINN
ncbi:CHAT domain-containing protein [Okeania sp. SIO3B5]|uniref:CHAT domain-containing protein n=1 Tax=Okeania sp. SIO3B5 TaxID=2607811 RepID=UPI0025D87291|nr:CHAT domain-containing protein [Okeania sp. SIO3B5]